MNFKAFMENERQKGKSLPETGYEYRKVVIYRACDASNLNFNSMDYVTRSERFAKGHADHTAAVSDEPAHVLKAYVESRHVFDAYNPGEYFYDGPIVTGQVIYVANP